MSIVIIVAAVPDEGTANAKNSTVVNVPPEEWLPLMRLEQTTDINAVDKIAQAIRGILT